MYYVMSDIHGEYGKYLLMLEKIKFSQKDVLFVLGDMVDRGQYPISVLKDMMLRPNVYPIMGNHDFLARYLLDKFSVEIDELSLESLSVEDINDLLSWLQDGGETTLLQYQKLNLQQRQEILDFLCELPFYETIDVGEKTFILVHAGLGNFRPDKKLSEYTVEELLLTRENPDRKFFEDDNIFIIHGHTPTPLITGKSEIYHSANNIYIDCGACFESGKLACLCLNTMEEFYIS